MPNKSFTAPTSPPKFDNYQIPAYISVAEFRSRLSWFSQSVAFKQRSEFREKVMSPRLASRGNSLPLIEASMEKLLRAKTRIFPAHGGHVVNLRSEYLSVRTIVIETSNLMRAYVEGAHASMVRAAALQSQMYIVDLNFEEDFAVATRHQVSSPAYLSWVVAVMNRPARDQQAIRHYCETENFWWWKTEGKQRYPDSSPLEHADGELDVWREQAGNELSKLLAAMSPEAASLLGQREMPQDGNWQWLQPWGLHATAWPMAGTLDGHEAESTLLDEANHWDALGRALSWLPFDAIVDASNETAESNALYIAALDAWIDCVDAGQSLCLLAGVLRACILPVPGQLCDRCYRHVGHDQRKRCSLHVTRAAERSQSTRLQELAERYTTQCSALRRQLHAEPAFTNPATYLSSCWNLHPVGFDPYAGKQHPVNRGKWPTMPPQEAVERLSNGLMQMLKRLEPVAGPVLHTRMLALVQWVQKNAVESIHAGNSEQGYATGTIVRQPESSHGRNVNAGIEAALRRLTPPGFFALWFGGCRFEGASAELQEGTDPDHLMLLELAQPNRNHRRSRQKNSAAKGQYVFSFEALVRDVLRHRAWIEMGGATADQAIRNGLPLMSDQAPQRVDIVQALQLQKEGLSLRRIGEILGVSGPAVHKALHKHAAVTAADTTKDSL